jgi:glyoxylase-like metal-dependent hydrolase (beta-lactamase superfamily II)
LSEQERAQPCGLTTAFNRSVRGSWSDKSAWLYPHFVGEDDTLKLSIHALLVEAPGLKLVVDTCIGNDRPREITGGQPLATPFLQHLGEAGWSRDGVDAVVCTHLHVDHVGWNTMLENCKWAPTFPKARYLAAVGRHGNREVLDGIGGPCPECPPDDN